MAQKRSTRKLTLRALSELVEHHGARIDASGLSRIESGEREPRLGEALAIAAALGVGITGLTDTDAVRLRNEQGNLAWVVGELDTWATRVVEQHADIEVFLNDLSGADRKSRAEEWLHIEELRQISTQLQAVIPSARELHRALMGNEHWLSEQGDTPYDETLTRVLEGPDAEA